MIKILRTLQTEFKRNGEIDLIAFVEAIYLSKERQLTWITITELCNLLNQPKQSSEDDSGACKHMNCDASKLLKIYHLHRNSMLPVSRKLETFNLIHTFDEVDFFFKVIEVTSNGGLSKKLLFVDTKASNMCLRCYTLNMSLIRTFLFKDVVQLERSKTTREQLTIIFRNHEFNLLFEDETEASR